jgi:hypothetical protein
LNNILKFLFLLSILLAQSGCSLINNVSDQSSTYLGTESPTITPATEIVISTSTNPAPNSTPVPILPISDTSSLETLVLGTLTPDVYDGIQILPMATFPGQPQLWAVYSTGLRNFEAAGSPSHFIAIFTRDATSNWLELSRINLETSPDKPSPDYIDNSGIKQVQIGPTRIWLTVEGGIGAHGGVFQLLSFDGKQLKIEITGSNDSPVAGSLQDVNNDGLLDAILNVSDNYVFCYACSVRKYAYEVYRWDSARTSMVNVDLTSLISDQPEVVAKPNNLAVSLALAGLWKDALVQAKLAMNAAVFDNTVDLNTVVWNLAIIQLHTDALGKAVIEGPYPLIANVFYGDYDSAVDIFHKYSPDQIFSMRSPLIIDTPAEGFESSLGTYLFDSANLALNLESELSSAYFIRAWAEYLKDPADPNIKADVGKALILSPGDPLFISANDFLK